MLSAWRFTRDPTAVCVSNTIRSTVVRTMISMLCDFSTRIVHRNHTREGFYHPFSPGGWLRCGGDPRSTLSRSRCRTSPRWSRGHRVSCTHHGMVAVSSKRRTSAGFGLRALPFLFLMGVGSWGLSQFLKLPTQLKDDARKRKRAGREKFDLEKEHERLEVQLSDERAHYENVRVPGPRSKDRRPAD